MNPTNIRPFEVAIPESSITNLKKRLASTRWPEQQTVGDWSQGVPLQTMHRVCKYWEEQYEWKNCADWLNRVGSYMANIDGLDIHFLHIRSSHSGALPLLLLHGWPGSILEFRKVVEPLTDPSLFGGNAEDSFHLVIPSMPGYGFSQKPSQAGTNHRYMGALYATLMEALGYDRWVAQGGDFGADICAKLASREPPKSLVAIHLNCLFFNAKKEIGSSSPSEAEKLALEKQLAFEGDEYAYFRLQATRPQTLGYSLADSPVGQAAWIYEKLHNWTQHDGDLETVLSIDEVLDNISLYWFTNTGASSARLYWEDGDDTALAIDIPVGVTVFPGELTCAPRVWGERYYSKIIHWTEVERGGHFAAWETPDIFVREIRDCFRHVRE